MCLVALLDIQDMFFHLDLKKQAILVYENNVEKNYPDDSKSQSPGY
jgi:hypothetical protein